MILKNYKPGIYFLYSDLTYCNWSFLVRPLKSVYNQELSSENLPQFVLGTISKLLVLFHPQQTRTLVDVLYTWCPLKSSPFIQYSINVASLMTRKNTAS